VERREKDKKETKKGGGSQKRKSDQLRRGSPDLIQINTQNKGNVTERG